MVCRKLLVQPAARKQLPRQTQRTPTWWDSCLPALQLRPRPLQKAAAGAGRAAAARGSSLASRRRPSQVGLAPCSLLLAACYTGQLAPVLALIRNLLFASRHACRWFERRHRAHPLSRCAPKPVSAAARRQRRVPCAEPRGDAVAHQGATPPPPTDAAQGPGCASTEPTGECTTNPHHNLIPRAASERLPVVAECIPAVFQSGRWS